MDRTAFEEQKAQQRMQVLQALGEQKWGQYVAALRQSAKIEDNRKELTRQNNAAAAAAAAAGQQF